MENKKVTLTGILSLRSKGKGLQAFTLVELIVVITILAILGTIAFISLQGYSKDARDSVRISDISKIKTSLELFQLDAGKYPETTDATNITYSGAIAWTQGIFGEKTFNNVTKLDKIPLDPVTDRKYVYSVTNTKQEYQIAGVMEGDEVTMNLNQPNPNINQPHPSPLIRGEGIDGILETNAAGKTAMLKISGNYNGKVLKVSTGGTDYVLAVPSIITSSGFTLEQIVAGKTLAYNGYKNLPAQYAGSSYDVLGDDGINLVNNADLVVYSGSLATLSSSELVGKDARKNLIEKLKSAYSGTAITRIGEIAQIISTDIEDETATEFLGTTIVSNNLGGSVAVSSGGGNGTPTNSCATQPSYTHATFTVGTPTSVNQEYVKDATNCGYTCTDGYTGTNCEIAPVQFLSNCTANGQIIYTDTFGIEIGRVNNAGTTVSGNPGSLTCAGHIIMCSGNNAGYVLQACNAGATTLYTNQTFTSETAVRNSTINARAGGLYQWGNKADISYTDTTTSRPTCTTDSTFSQSMFITGNSDWCSVQTDNVWGGSTGANVARIGPCATGYHVPTQSEWGGVITSGLWGTTSGTNMISTLKLPMAGNRNRSDVVMNNQGNYGLYWSSSPFGTNGYSMDFTSTNITPSANHTRAGSFSVRCFKN